MYLPRSLITLWACLGPRCVAYERETRKNPVERLATNARLPAVHNAKRGKNNYASQNRKSGLRAAYVYTRRAFLTLRPKQGLCMDDTTTVRLVTSTNSVGAS